MQKRISKKLLAILLCAVLAVCAATGGTMAYIFSKAPPVNNTFDPVFVSCLVEEHFDGTTKTDVKVKNTGDINAFIRATFVVMWTAEDGTVYASSPVENTDYVLELGSPKWLKGTDGFYYYSNPVASNETTDILIRSLTLIGEAPDGYGLAVHVSATAIQAEPVEAIQGVWGAAVQSNGNLVAP